MGSTQGAADHDIKLYKAYIGWHVPRRVAYKLSEEGRRARGGAVELKVID